MDFGKSFSKEGLFFSEFRKPRSSNTLTDLFELGLLPKIPGIYRRDYARHMNFGGSEENSIDAVLLTHAHLDHCDYIQYLREDIPIFCSEETYLILKNFDDTGSSQYLTSKQKFQIHSDKKGRMIRSKGDDTKLERKFFIFKSEKKFNIDSIEVNPLPVDHAIPGVHAFILNTPDGTIGNTADLRFHGRRRHETEKFVQTCANSDLDVLLCEGTRVEDPPSITEFDIETKATELSNNTKELVICGYPIRDLDRFVSFYNAAKNSGRILVIDPKQAYLLKLFDLSPNLKGKFPAHTDENLRIFIPRGTWGLIDKDINHFTEKLLEEDYGIWQREFLKYSNSIDYREIHQNQKKYMFYCSDFKLSDLIDIKPSDGSTYIRSLTEPFNDEMEIKNLQIKNWFIHFGIVKKESDWNSIHVSGHGDGEQIKYIIENSNAKKLIPIHTEKDEYHKKWHTNVNSVSLGSTFSL